jgi:hypothetical protein
MRNAVGAANEVPGYSTEGSLWEVCCWQFQSHLDQSTTGGGGNGRRSEVEKGASGGGEGEVQFTGVYEASTE